MEGGRCQAGLSQPRREIRAIRREADRYQSRRSPPTESRGHRSELYDLSGVERNDETASEGEKKSRQRDRPIDRKNLPEKMSEVNPYEFGRRYLIKHSVGFENVLLE